MTDVVRRRSGRRTIGAKGKAAAFASHFRIWISKNVSRGSGTIVFPLVIEYAEGLDFDSVPGSD